MTYLLYPSQPGGRNYTRVHSRIVYTDRDCTTLGGYLHSRYATHVTEQSYTNEVNNKTTVDMYYVYTLFVMLNTHSYVVCIKGKV